MPVGDFNRLTPASGHTDHAFRFPRETAEELNLRYNTHYIAPNAATVLVGALSLLLGAMATFVVVLAPPHSPAAARLRPGI